MLSTRALRRLLICGFKVAVNLCVGFGRICLPGVPGFLSRAHRSPEVGWLASNTFPPGVTGQPSAAAV
jgi:hypothetical protein